MEIYVKFSRGVFSCCSSFIMCNVFVYTFIHDVERYILNISISIPIPMEFYRITIFSTLMYKFLNIHCTLSQVAVFCCYNRDHIGNKHPCFHWLSLNLCKLMQRYIIICDNYYIFI